MDGVLQALDIVKIDCDRVSVLRPHLIRVCLVIVSWRVLLILGIGVIAVELNGEVYN